MTSKESYKQDLVISIRYKNDLPPPSMPPKLLEIDTGGLQQYLDPGFAASIAKREEPNIEADAEGGMPIDVIGMYGYFEGDESSIMAPDVAPPLDPEDEALMLNPEQMKAGGAVSTSNFLRKTQYMTATSGRANDPLSSTLPKIRRQSTSKPAVLARDDKENIKRHISKAFDLAHSTSRQPTSTLPITQQERTAWDRPSHPSNKSLKPISFHPVYPDFDAATVIGPSWNLLRFDKPPLPAIKSKSGPYRDNRLDAAFLFSSVHPAKQKQYEAQKAAYERDPASFDDPGHTPTVWSLLLPRDQAATSLIRTAMNTRHLDHDDEAMLSRITEKDELSDTYKIPFSNARFYANATSQDRESGRHTRQVVLTLTDPDPVTGVGSAHYYPIGQANKLLSDRATDKNSKDNAWRPEFEAGLPDQVLVEIVDPLDGELVNRYAGRLEYDPMFQSTFDDIYRRAEEQGALADQFDVGVEPHGNGDEHVKDEKEKEVEAIMGGAHSDAQAIPATSAQDAGDYHMPGRTAGEDLEMKDVNDDDDDE